MKKALSVLLSMLMIFSMVGVMAFAEGEETETVLVEFINEGQVIASIEAVPGTILNKYAPEYPTKEDTETTRFTFKGWECSEDGKLYYANSTLPVPAEGQTKITFTAVYSEEDLSDRMTFWNFIESIFERINLIFEYFATVFSW